MSSLVVQLQQDALDKNVAIADVLRKAKVVARKLGLHEFAEWVDFELAGYSGPDEVPGYRVVRGTPKAHNPARGIIPLNFQDPKWEDVVSMATLFQKISEIEDLIRSTSEGGRLSLSFASEHKAILKGMMNYPLEPFLQIDRSRLVGVVDSVRNTILDWTLKLEEQGILGEGMTFTERERERANANNYYIQNVGVLGNVTDQATVKNKQKARYQKFDLEKIENLLQQIEQHMASLENPSIAAKITSQISSIRTEVAKPKPDHVRLKSYLSSIKTIAEGVTGNLVAAGIVQIISTYL